MWSTKPRVAGRKIHNFLDIFKRIARILIQRLHISQDLQQHARSDIQTTMPSIDVLFLEVLNSSFGWDIRLTKTEYGRSFDIHHVPSPLSKE